MIVLQLNYHKRKEKIMFIGRKKELKELKNKINSDKFEFVIIYGRRQIGKTYLLQKIKKEYQAIYFVANKLGLGTNLANLSNIILDYFKELNPKEDNLRSLFENFTDLFYYLKQKNKIWKPLILMIDEFSYLIDSNKGILSEFQNIVDHVLKDTQIKLILSGSYLGMMKEADEYHQPLYGRTTSKILLKPFDYYEAALFYPRMNNNDKIRLYSVFGGIPFYLKEIDDQKSVKENIVDIILKSTKSISIDNNIQNLLSQEIRKTKNYIQILQSIALGTTQFGKIMSKSDFNNKSFMLYFLNHLINLNLVEKEICFNSELHNTKKTAYKIKDSFIHFYYKFLYSQKTAQNNFEPEKFYQFFIEPYLDEFVSLEFERICKIFLTKKYLNQISNMGRYWFNNSFNKTNIEIDIIIEMININNQKNEIIKKQITFFECKWTNQFDIRVIKELEDKVQLLINQKPFNTYPEIQLGFFSKNGYDKGMKEQYPNYSFYSVDDLYNLSPIENNTPSITLKTLKELLLDKKLILTPYFSRPLTFYWRDLEAVHNVDNQHIIAYDHSKIECDLLQQQDGNFFIRFSKKFAYYFAHAYPVEQEQTAFVNKFIAIYQHFIPFYQERLSNKKDVIWSQKDPEYEASIYGNIFNPNLQEIFYDDFFNHFFWLFQGTEFQALVSSFGFINLQIHYSNPVYNSLTINQYLTLNSSVYAQMMDFHIQTQFQYFEIRNLKNIIQPEWFFIPRSDSKISFLSRLRFTLTFDQINSSFNYRPYLNLYLPDDDQFIDDFSTFNEDLFLGLLKLKILGPEKNLIQSLLGLTENQIEIFYNPRQKKLKLSFQKEWLQIKNMMFNKITF